MVSSKRKLTDATNKLVKFFDLPNAESVEQALNSLEKLTGSPRAKTSPTEKRHPNKLEIELNNLLINTSGGALLTTKLIKRLQELGTGTRINDLLGICFVDNGEKSNIKELLQLEDNSPINSTIDSPSKEAPNISIIFSNSVRVSLEQRNVDAVTIFMNGIPSLELARATPFVNIQFFFPRPPRSGNNEIQSLSLVKFLEGAKKVNENTAESLMVDGASVTAGLIASSKAAAEQSPTYSTAGMELFTSPQTLVNADMTDNESLRANPVLDKFRPLLSFNDLEITIVPTKGLMSNKTATMKMTLHDRSRLSEVAELIRPDMYALNEIMIEYGWHHPDGESIVGTDNPYGDLINGMRLKEKFGIINSSFTFTDAGAVEITLKLSMRGSIAFDTELISSTDKFSGNTMKEIEKLQELVGKLREKVFPQSAKSKEIRGVQILDAASDATSYFTLSPELKKALNQITADLNKGNPDAKQLSKALNELLADSNKKGNTSLVQKLKQNIIGAVDEKMKKLTNIKDPFLDIAIDSLEKKGSETAKKSGRTAKRIGTGRNKKPTDAEKAAPAAGTAPATGATPSVKKIDNTNIKNVLNGEISLATLLLHFVAEPLANSKQFDEIQFIYYPFNSYAAFARDMNIGNFIVDMGYLSEMLTKYRLEHVSKSGIMTLNQFLSFLAEILLDDPAARSFGLMENGKPLFKDVTKDGQTSIETVDEAPTYNDRVNKLLKTVTPDGTFRMPQIQFYVEALSEDIDAEDGQDILATNGRTILRIHVFDKQASSYTTLSSLLSSMRDTELDNISLAGKNNNTSTSDKEKNKRKQSDQEIAELQSKANLDQANAVIKAAADSEGLIRPVADNSDMYTVSGGSRKLKEFIQSSMPYIIYGAQGTTILKANLSSIQDPKLNTVNLLRSFQKSQLQPNGENPGGLPMRVIPTQLEINMLGCPLIDFAQAFYVDFQSGTTADNIYAVSGITHKFSAGSFATDVKFGPLDAYGKYTSVIDKVTDAIKTVAEYSKQIPGSTEPPSSAK